MTPSATPADPLIISFVSGKGGVGKTMLAAAFAKQLSAGVRTLIVDLDFFNRGLTGLIGTPAPFAEFEAPSFLRGEGKQSAADWAIAEIDVNLCSIVYPDLNEDELKKFATLDVHVLAEAIREMILRAATLARCSCVVVDCHGGPDNSSFAACLFSRHTLLISEPDRITLYGTLHFVRQMNAIAGNQINDIRLVYNKVVPAFSSRFLVSVYNRTIRKYLQNRALLAIFPLEVYLTKEFERTTFLTAVYPYSLLAGKTNVMIRRLLTKQHKDLLSPSVVSLPKLLGRWYEWTLGNAPALFRLDSLLKIIAVLGLLAFGLVRANDFYDEYREQTPSPDDLRLYTAVLRIEMLAFLSDSAASATAPGAAELNEEQRAGIRDFVEGRTGYEQVDGLHSSVYSRFRVRLLQQFGGTYPLPEEFQPPYVGDSVWERARVLSRKPPNEGLSRLAEANPSVIEEQIKILSEELYRRQRWLGPKDGLDSAARTLSDAGAPAAFAGMIWTLIVLLGSWSTNLDRKFTYYSRHGRSIRMIGYFVAATAIWFFPLFLASALMTEYNPIRGMDWISLTIWSASLSFLAFTVGQQLLRGVRNIRYDHVRFEGGLRIAFAAYVASAVTFLSTILGI